MKSSAKEILRAFCGRDLDFVLGADSKTFDSDGDETLAKPLGVEFTPLLFINPISINRLDSFLESKH
jgi:hypothetical protein